MKMIAASEWLSSPLSHKTALWNPVICVIIALFAAAVLTATGLTTVAASVLSAGGNGMQAVTPDAPACDPDWQVVPSASVVTGTTNTLYGIAAKIVSNTFFPSCITENN
jgi:hypothetical protein